MNTIHTNPDTTATALAGMPLDPPIPPVKPERLLWIDVETTGLNRDESKLLEIGMIVTGMDGVDDGDQFTTIVRPTGLDLFDISPAALRMHLTNGLWDMVAGSAHQSGVGYPVTAVNLNEFI
ncbi:exonuclease domain-containing protein [Bifidobacterium miconis]|uniref:exonuclease domain-containing protein n=1 Tax=Bifidobacterium miconis TaxID=2834435 RepID=UPI001F18716A|nr:exonuclease domain-containing protein [Bifidobacterium miconis]